MIKFNKPTNLNGAELIAELKSVGVVVEGYPEIDGNGDLWLNINAADENIANQIVAVHNGNIIPREPTVQDKLAFVGLSIDDLKQVLGL